MSGKRKRHESSTVSFACGIVAGIAQAGLFNPYDRALYLSVKHKRPFLSSVNFQSPYQGFLQSVGGRALSGGLYYPLEHFFIECVDDNEKNNDGGTQQSTATMFFAGTAAGAMNAMLLNPLSALKYKTWGRDVSRGLICEAKSMLRKGGARPFFNGLFPTLMRDVAFGGCYTYLRHAWRTPSSSPQQKQPYIVNVLAAAVATVASGPFNLARNVQYATRSRKVAPTTLQVLVKLVRDVSCKETVMEKFHHVQNRLRIGWGTARVAVGMAFGQLLYDTCMHMYHDILE